FLNYVREVSADAYEHQDAPYELIVDRTADVVGTMFTFEVADDRSLDLSGMITREIEVPIPGAMFDISLDAIERNGVVYLDFEYDSTVLDEQIVRSWADCYTGFIESVCENPDALIGAVPLIPNNQFHDLFSQRNDNNHEHQGRGTVLDIIDAITVSHPDAPAVIEGGQVTTYAELNAISDHAAEMLISRYGIGPENLVAVCAPASVEVVAVILGILKAGGAFLPLEHDGPDARATRIFDTDNVSLLIGGGDLFDRLNAKKKCPITSLIAPRKKGKATTLPRPSPNSLAYVIYTSGSTGRPKGCEIEHASLYNYVVWAIEHYFFGRDAGNFCLTSSLAFDLSLMSLFVPLCMGSILRIPEGNTAEALALAVSTGTETDVLNLTPSHIRMIGSLGVEQTNVKIAVVGGEALRREDIDTLLALKPDMEIHNEYGPTEATIGCTSGRVFPGQPLTVGYPISNTIAVIVDNDMRPVPHGAWGELCIGGAGLARGYRNLPELTRERFIPFGPDGQRVYRTGDIARMMADGCIELGGRIDEQLKIGGHRIEPGEIESALMMCEGVSEAAVVQSNGDSLVAFVVGEGDSEDIRRESALLIPAYMVPRFVVMTSVIPVLPSGKIDRKTLVRTAGELTPRQTTCDDKYPVSPCLRIMRELSGNPEMRPSDNFFTAGGNSLDAVAVVARCRKELGLPIDLGAFFSNPTAETIERCGSEEPGFRSLIHTPKRREIPQTSGQKQIWLASQKGGSAYAMTEMFLFEGALDVALFHRSFMELVKRHEILRTTFHERGGELYQTVQTFSPESLYYEYIDRISGDDPECAAIWRADEESRFMFDLAKGPLVRVIMIPLDENRHLCLLNIHHIITDGWSAALMLDEVSRIYRSVISEVEKPGWQYRDFAVWHEEYLSGSEAARDLDFWRKALVPPLPELSLPGRCANDGTGVRPSGIVDIRINTSVVQSLEALARENGATLFMAILTGCAALMHQRTSAGDIVIGTPSAGRVLPEFETMPGYFLNTVPIRIAVDGGMTFRDLLRESVRRTSDAFAHQLYPFDLLADKFAGAQSDSRNPLFDVMVILQNTADYRFDLPEVTASRFYTPRSSEAKFEIMIEMETSPDGLCGIIEYDRSVYPKEIMESFARDLQTTLRHIVCSPDIPVSSLFAMFSSENNLSRDRFIRSLSDISEDF
ncbi:MAG: amino acid adenylation domain-containing protein, partial [Candidatus Latescibacterota bacterium]